MTQPVPSSPWRLALPLASLFLFAGPTAPAAAAPRLPEQAFETVKEEGPITARDAYYELRRQKLGGGEINAAAARARALEEKAAAQRPASPDTGTVWSPLGPQPINLGQTPQNGSNRSDVSGRANAVVIDAGVGSPHPIYLGTAQGGVWKSTDDGVTWSPISDFLNSLAVGALALDTTAHTATTATIYLGTGEANGSGDSYAGVGVYKSTDSGATWSGPFGAAQFTGRTIGSITIDRLNPNILIAATASGIFGSGQAQSIVLPPRGIYRSIDAGATWTCQTCGAGTDSNRYSNVVQDPLVATTWFAAGWHSTIGAGTLNGGIIKSIDNGVTWTQVAGTGTLPAAAAAWGRATVTVAALPAAANSTYYLGSSFTNAGQNPGRIFKSVDSGVNWTQLASANGYCMGQCFYDQPVWAQPDDPQIVYHGGAGAVATAGITRSNVRRSTDGGTTFADIMISADATTAVHSDTHVLITDPTVPTTLWAASDGGIWRSTDRGTNWATRNANINTVQFTGVDLHPANPSIAYGGTQDNGTNSGSGALGWAHSDDGDGGYALIDQTDPNNVVHTYFNQSGSLMAATTSLLGTASGPNDYTTIVGACSAASCGVLVNNGIPLADRTLFYAPMHLDRGSTDTLYFGTNKLYRSPGFFAAAQTAAPLTVIFNFLGTGASGQDLTGGATGAISSIETFAAQAPAHGGTNAAIIYTGSSTGRVFRSTDTGASFTQVDAPGLFVADIAINPSNSQIVYTALSGFSGSAGQNVRKSIDGGTTWAPSGTGIPDIPVNALVVDPTDNTRIWAGTDVGVYLSANSGANWAPYGTGLPNVAVVDLKAATIPGGPPIGQLVAATHGRGMWKLIGLTPAELLDFEIEP